MTDDDGPRDGGGQYRSSEDWERAVAAEAERRELSSLTRALQAAQKSLEDRMAQMSTQVTESLAKLHDDWRTQAGRFEGLSREWETRSQQFRVSDVTPAQSAKLADLLIFWDQNEAMVRAIVQRYMTQSIVEQRHQQTTAQIGKHAAIIASFATATAAAIAGIITLATWLYAHIH